MATIALPYSTDGGLDGLFNYLGTRGGTVAFANPATARNLSVASRRSVAGWQSELVTDHVLTGGYTSSGGAAAWSSPGDAVVWDLGNFRSMATSRFAIRSRADISTHYPTNFALEGSDDGQTWTNIHTVAANAFTAAAQWKSWATTDAATSYRFLRLRSTGNNSSATEVFNLTEVELWGTLTETVPAVDYSPDSNYGTTGVLRGEGVTVLASGDLSGAFPRTATVDNNLATSWHSSNLPGTWIGFDLGPTTRCKPHRIDIASRHDNIAESLHEAKIQGSQDGVHWTDLEHIQPYPGLFVVGRFYDSLLGKWRAFWIDPPATAYRFLRVLNLDANYLASAEIEVFGEVEDYDPPPTPVVESVDSVAQNTSGASITLAKPAGVAVGDVLLFAIFQRDGVNIGSPAGVTDLDELSGATSTRRYVGYRVIDGTEGASFTFTAAGGLKTVGVVVRISGADPVAPIGDWSVASGAAATVPTFTSVDVDREGTIAILIPYLLAHAPSAGEQLWSATTSAGSGTSTVGWVLEAPLDLGATDALTGINDGNPWVSHWLLFQPIEPFVSVPASCVEVAVEPNPVTFLINVPAGCVEVELEPLGVLPPVLAGIAEVAVHLGPLFLRVDAGGAVHVAVAPSVVDPPVRVYLGPPPEVEVALPALRVRPTAATAGVAVDLLRPLIGLAKTIRCVRAEVELLTVFVAADPIGAGSDTPTYAVGPRGIHVTDGPSGRSQAPGPTGATLVTTP